MIANSLLRTGLIGENLKLANKITNYFSDKEIAGVHLPNYISTAISRV